MREVEGRKHIRAISKSRRQAAKQERSPEAGGGREPRPERGGERGERRDRRRDGDGEEVPGDRRLPRPREGGQWWAEGRGGWPPQDDGPTFEQQLAQGFRPVYQGERVVAMARGNESVKPGRPETRGKDGGKGDRKGNGKGWKGDPADGDQDGGMGEGGGKGDRYRNREPRQDRYDPATLKQLRWRVMAGQEAIVREAWAVDSDVVGTFNSGSLVSQLSEDKVLRNGIIRMLVEGVEPQTGLKGWVTRSAKAAGGPVFFQPERAAGGGDTGGGRGKGGGYPDNRGGAGGRDGGDRRDGGGDRRGGGGKDGGRDRNKGGDKGSGKGSGAQGGKGKRPFGE